MFIYRINITMIHTKDLRSKQFLLKYLSMSVQNLIFSHIESSEQNNFAIQNSVSATRENHKLRNT